MTEHEEQIQFWRDKAVEYAISHSKGEPAYFRDALYSAYLQAVQDALRIRLI